MVSAKNKHVDQWNSAEVSPHTYGELIFDKSGKNIQGLLSSTNGVGKAGQLHWIKEVRPHVYPIHRSKR